MVPKLRKVSYASALERSAKYIGSNAQVWQCEGTSLSTLSVEFRASAASTPQLVDPSPPRSVLI